MGRQRTVADAQHGIVSDFKVRVTYSSADASKPRPIRDGLPKDVEPYTTG
jgi:hypothetical protein